MSDRIRVQIVLDGANAVRRSLSDIAKTGGEAFGNLRSSVQGVGEALATMGRRTAVGLTAAAGAITATGAALRGLVSPAAAAAESLENAATSLGTSAEKLAELQFAFGRAGVRPEQAQQTLSGFARRIRDAAEAERQAQQNREQALTDQARNSGLVRVYSQQAETLARALTQGDDAVTAALERLYRNAEREATRGASALDRAAGQRRMQEIAQAVRSGPEGARAFLERQLDQVRSLRDQAVQEGGRATEALDASNTATNPSQRAFQRLGVATTDAAGNVRPLNDVLRDTAEAFSRLPDGPEKTALAIDLFGEQGVRLIPILNRGAAGLDQLAERARRLGVVLGPGATQVLTEYQAAADEMADTFTGLRNTIAVVVAPALTAFSKTLQGLIERNRVAIGQGLANALERVRPIVNDLLNMLSGGTAQTDFVRGLVEDWEEVRRVLGIVGRFFADDLVPVMREVVIPAVRAVRDAFTEVALRWNELTGSNATGGQVALVLALAQISGALRLVGAAAGLALTAIKAIGSIGLAVLTPIVGLFGSIATKIGTAVGGAGAAKTAFLALAGVLTSTPALIAGIGVAAVGLGYAIAANWDSVRDGATTAFSFVGTAFEEALAAIGEAIGSVGGFFVAAFENLPTLLRFAWEGITTGFRAAWDFLSVFIPQVVQNFVSGFTQGVQQLRTLFESLFTGIRDFAFAAAREILDFWRRQFESLGRIIDRIRGAFSRAREQTNEEFDRARERRGFASGGYVSGPGTGTSDSILARLSNGEFVVRAAAVQRYGVSFLQALNTMRLPAFAAGGLVQPLDVRIRSGMPAFAEGGLVSATGAGGRPLTLVVGGETISGFSGNDAAMETLERRLRRDARARNAAPAPWQRRNG